MEAVTAKNGCDGQAEPKTEFKEEEVVAEIKTETDTGDGTEAKNADETEAKLQDPFAYLDRNDFTSEKYKIEVRNLPKHYGFAVSVL